MTDPASPTTSTPATAPSEADSPSIPWGKRLFQMFLLVIWCLVLLIPALFFYLAAYGEIAVQQGELPNQTARVWLISEIDVRGFGLAYTSVQALGENQCVQTETRYLLWQGQGEAATDCECFRADETGAWRSVSTQMSACQGG
jgi:hypothetical protein